MLVPVSGIGFLTAVVWWGEVLIVLKVTADVVQTFKVLVTVTLSLFRRRS